MLVCCAMESISPMIFSIFMDMSLIFCMESVKRCMRDCVCRILSEVVPVAAVTEAEAFTLLFSSSVSWSIVSFRSSTAFSCSPVPLKMFSAFSSVSPDTAFRSLQAFLMFWIMSLLCSMSCICCVSRLSFSRMLCWMPATILLMLSDSMMNSGLPCSSTVIPKFPSAISCIELEMRLIPRTILLSTMWLIISSSTPNMIIMLRDTTIVWLRRPA